MSLSNFQLQILLSQIQEKINHAEEKARLHMTDTYLYLSTREEGISVGLKQAQLLLMEMMNEAEKKRQIELDRLRQLDLDISNAMLMTEGNPNDKYVVVDMEKATEVLRQIPITAIDFETYTIPRCHIHGEELDKGRCVSCEYEDETFFKREGSL